MQAELCLDLTELDAVAAQLHLMIAAAEIFEGAVAAPSGEVAAAIKPSLRAEQGGLDEALRGEIGLVQITPRDTGPAHQYLAGGTDRHRETAPVDDEDVQVIERPSDQVRGAFGV